MWRRRRPARPAANGSRHRKAMDDLKDKDEVIDSLLGTAESLVGELRAEVARASARLRGPAEGEHEPG